MNAWEQKEFIESISQNLAIQVLTEKQWHFSKTQSFDCVLLWPFEYLQESEVYFELVGVVEQLWLASWSMNKDHQLENLERARLGAGSVSIMKDKRWRPYNHQFWQYWQQEIWRREFCWGRMSSVVYVDEKDLRELKRFFKKEEISYLKKSLIPLSSLKKRVPAFDEDLCFTYRASQSIEYRYFLGFQHRPHMRIYLIQYFKLVLEKLLSPLRPI